MNTETNPSKSPSREQGATVGKNARDAEYNRIWCVTDFFRTCSLNECSNINYWSETLRGFVRCQTCREPTCIHTGSPWFEEGRESSGTTVLSDVVQRFDRSTLLRESSGVRTYLLCSRVKNLQYAIPNMRPPAPRIRTIALVDDSLTHSVALARLYSTKVRKASRIIASRDTVLAYSETNTTITTTVIDWLISNWLIETHLSTTHTATCITFYSDAQTWEPFT